MCIMCGISTCSAHGTAPEPGKESAQAMVGGSYALYDWKWGTPDLGTPSSEITWSMNLAGLMFNGRQLSAQELSEYEDAVRDAFAAWASHANLNFREVADGALLDISVQRLEDLPNSNVGSSTVGLAQWGQNSFTVGPDNVDDDINQTQYANVYFDSDQSWLPDEDGFGGLSLYAVALHEIGHTLGLDHVNDRAEILNPTIFADDLGDGDIAGIQALYGVRSYGSETEDDIDLSDGSTGLTIMALAGNDQVSATQGDDRIVGGSGNDTLNGNAGDDLIIDTSGINTLNGGANNDTLIGGTGQITASGDGGNDILIGGIGDDSLNGGSGDDILRGDPGNSFVFGDDTLTAGTGNDILAGGGGSDTFVFQTGGGTNTIGTFQLSNGQASITGQDYQAGIDQVDLTGFGYNSFADVESQLRTAGSDTIFNDQNTSITFVGITIDQLTSEDFLL